MTGNEKSSRQGRAPRRAIQKDATAPAGENGPVDGKIGAVDKPRNAFNAESLFHLGTADSISKMILDTVSDGIYCLDLSGITTFVNPAAARMTGWEPVDLVGHVQHEMVHHSHADGTTYPQDLCPIYAVLRDGHSYRCEDEVFWRKDGTSFPVSYTSTPIFIDGALTGTVVSFQDISERIRRDRWQRGKHSVFHSITMHHPLQETLQLLASAYTEYDSNCSIALLLRDDSAPANLLLIAGSRLPAQLEELLKVVAIEGGVSACGEAARLGDEVFVDTDRNDALSSTCCEIAVPSVERCLALPMISANGKLRGVTAFFHVIAPGSRESGPDNPQMPAEDIVYAPYRAVRDIAQIAIETRTLHSSLIHQSEHDHLTGLPNRLLFEDRLVHAIRACDLSHRRLAVCLVDIDRFRRVNENYGHLVGDELLQQITDRFQRCLRAIDVLARESGDEFIVMLPELGSADDAEPICRRLLLAMTAPFAVQGQSIMVSANMGICMYPDHAATPEMLIQNAESAADVAKENGYGNLQVFRADLGERVRQLAIREAALATALARNEFYLVYQPLYDASRRVHGFEALLRWNNPDLGLIPPDQFIPLAESTGLILPIGEWVLNQACRQAMAWKAEVLGSTKIFVNVSALQLGQGDFTSTVSKALRASGLSPSRLEIEVTESLILPSFRKTTDTLQPLQDLGVSIAIDDFGTGHSSFGVLHKLPIDAIKVDRSFVSRIDRDASGLSTVRTIIDLARQLGMKTVGEGVETERQFKLLQEMKCDYFQGYLLSRPLTPEAAELLFEQVEPLLAADPAFYPEPLKVSA